MKLVRLIAWQPATSIRWTSGSHPRLRAVHRDGAEPRGGRRKAGLASSTRTTAAIFADFVWCVALPQHWTSLYSHCLRNLRHWRCGTKTVCGL